LHYYLIVNELKSTFSLFPLIIPLCHPSNWQSHTASIKITTPTIADDRLKGSKVVPIILGLFLAVVSVPEISL
jgi:hypothetical protein